MRTLFSFLFGLLTMAAAVAFGLVAAQNSQGARLAFFENSAQLPLGWAVAGAAALGFLLAFLLLVPGRLASALRTERLTRNGLRLEERLRQLRVEYAQLEGSHQRLLEEHQRVLYQALAPVAAGGEPAQAAAALAMPAATVDRLRRTGPILPERRAERPDPPAQTVRPKASLLDRLRRRLAAWKAQVQAWFQRQRGGDSSSTNGPTTAAA